jgi:uncharacterized protein
MNSTNHRLTLVHGKLDAEIRREQTRPLPDPWRLLRLKKLRLAIKDRMYRLLQVRRQRIA